MVFKASRLPAKADDRYEDHGANNAQQTDAEVGVPDERARIIRIDRVSSRAPLANFSVVVAGFAAAVEAALAVAEHEGELRVALAAQVVALAGQTAKLARRALLEIVYEELLCALRALILLLAFQTVIRANNSEGSRHEAGSYKSDQKVFGR